MASGCRDCSSSAVMPPTNIAESPCTRRIGRSLANQRSPGALISRLRSGPCGPATRAKIASLRRPRTRSAGLAAFTLPLSAVVARAQPGEVVGDRALGIVGGLVAGVFAEPADVEEGSLARSGRAPAFG